MMFSALLANRSPYRKLLVLVGFALFSVVVFTMLGGLLSAVLLGINPLTNPNIMNDTANPQVLSSLKLMQTFSAFGLFIFPVLFAAFLFDAKPFAWLKLTKVTSVANYVLVVITILFAAPIINGMMELNQHLSLPHFLKAMEDWMKASEARAADITKLFVATDTYTGLALNLFIIALLPAIGEELLFRGAIQRLLTELTNNKHAGIILSAIIFSAIHMQFYGFLPRMMLGVYFGYLVVWSGSLWPAILGHFINNAMAVIFFFIQKRNQLPFDPDKIGVQQGDELMLLAALIITTVCIWNSYSISRRKETSLRLD